MTDQDMTAATIDPADDARAARRRFLQLAGGAGVAVGGLSLLAACGGDDDDGPGPSPSPSPSPSPTATSTTNPDADALNFLLELEYLSAQFFAVATSGAGLPDSLLGGAGTRGEATGGRQAPLVGQVAAWAREIAADDRAHVAYLRAQLAAAAVAQPAIDLSPGGAFTAIARAAGVVGGATTFDPYATEENFLYAAFLLKDVMVTAYKGVAPLTATSSYIPVLAGIAGAEAHHAGIVRATLFGRGLTNAPGRISDARDALDGAADFDQGITGADAGVANITPADSNGLAFARSTGQVLNILFVNKAEVSTGGFYPAGLNGAVKKSAASG